MLALAIIRLGCQRLQPFDRAFQLRLEVAISGGDDQRRAQAEPHDELGIFR
jgi:hypothetical protein